MFERLNLSRRFKRYLLLLVLFYVLVFGFMCYQEISGGYKSGPCGLGWDLIFFFLMWPTVFTLIIASCAKLVSDGWRHLAFVAVNLIAAGLLFYWDRLF